MNADLQDFMMIKNKSMGLWQAGPKNLSGKIP
jgi:hypothetical protein